MNKTEILSIVNEPSKHIQIVKIDGKDSIVYSSKFVELLELIPTMLAKADMVVILDEIRAEIEQEAFKDVSGSKYIFVNRVNQIIDKYKAQPKDMDAAEYCNNEYDEER